MATYIITFLNNRLSEDRYEYQHEGKIAQGRVFPEALKDLVKFDTMYICTTEAAKQTTWKQYLEGQENVKKIDIPDGQNAEELWEIFNKVTEKFSANDEVIFDITHAFRSLPFLTFLFSAYLQVAKNVKITSVLYGAIEQGQESNTPGIKKIAPVIQISEFVPMLDWMSATQRFVDLGDGNGLVKLLRNLLEQLEISDSNLQKTITETANAIERVSDALIYIRPMEVMESVSKLNELISQLRDSCQDLLQIKPFLLLLDQITERYRNLAVAEPFEDKNIKQNLEAQLEIVSWYQNHQQQIKSIALARELFISILMYGEGQINDIFNYNQRKFDLKKLNKIDYPDCENIKTLWDNTRKPRNDFAHTGMSQNPKSIADLKKETDDSLNEIKKCLAHFLQSAHKKYLHSLVSARPNPRTASPKLKKLSN